MTEQDPVKANASNRERRDADPEDGRDETVAERMDRNWNEILQELRVTQTGTQIISGFLLTVIFQERFKEASTPELSLYIGLVILAGVTTALGLAPVGVHRALFGKHQKDDVVATANRFLLAVLMCVSILTAGVITLIVTFALNWSAGLSAGVAVLLLLLVLLVWIPHRTRKRHAS